MLLLAFWHIGLSEHSQAVFTLFLLYCLVWFQVWFHPLTVPIKLPAFTFFNSLLLVLLWNLNTHNSSWLSCPYVINSNLLLHLASSPIAVIPVANHLKSCFYTNQFEPNSAFCSKTSVKASLNSSLFSKWGYNYFIEIIIILIYFIISLAMNCFFRTSSTKLKKKNLI